MSKVSQKVSMILKSFILLIGVLCSSQILQAQVTLSASPTMLNFQTKPGTISPLQTSSVFFNFYQEGSISLWTNVGCSAPFTVSSSCVGHQWFSGTCQIQADYRPRQPGNDSCTVQVYANEGGFVSIMLQGYSK